VRDDAEHGSNLKLEGETGFGKAVLLVTGAFGCVGPETGVRLISAT